MRSPHTLQMLKRSLHENYDKKHNLAVFNPHWLPKQKQKDENTYTCTCSTRTHTPFCTFCERQDFFRSHKLVKWIFFIGELDKKKKKRSDRDPANYTFKYTPREIKKYVHTETCTPMLTAAYSQKPKGWTAQLPTNRWMDRLCKVPATEYYSATETKCCATARNLETIMLS